MSVTHAHIWTPGPIDGARDIYDELGRQIAYVADGFFVRNAAERASIPPKFTTEEIADHTRLIALAPEMEQALRAAWESAQSMAGCNVCGGVFDDDEETIPHAAFCWVPNVRAILDRLAVPA